MAAAFGGKNKLTDGETLVLLAQGFKRGAASGHQQTTERRDILCRLAELERLLAAPVASIEGHQAVARLKAAHVLVIEMLASLDHDHESTP